MEISTSKLFAEETIDIKKYFAKILFNWYWFAISVFITVSIAYVLNRYTEPIYRVSSSLIVRDDERSKGLTGAENIIQGMEMFRSQKNVQNEIGILKSFTIANRAIQELNDFEVTYIAVGRRGFKEAKLYTSSPFIVKYDSLSRQIPGEWIDITILSKDEYLLEINENLNIHRRLKFGDRFTNEYFDFTVNLRHPESFIHNPKSSNKYYFFFNNQNGLTNNYRGKLVIETNDKKGSILTLSTTGFVATQEVDYLNKLMDIYIRSGLEGGEVSEFWNLEKPEVVQAIHKSYFDAGSDVVMTNTFGGSPLKLKKTDLHKHTEEINRTAVQLAKEVAGKEKYGQDIS